MLPWNNPIVVNQTGVPSWNVGLFPLTWGGGTCQWEYRIPDNIAEDDILFD